MMAARRDASWYASPGAAWRYHVSVDLVAACNSRVALTENTLLACEYVPERMRCQRSACKKHWPENAGAKP